jgi:hypothetical protein
MKQVNMAQEIKVVKKDDYADVKPMYSREYYEGNMHLEVRQREIHMLDNVNFLLYIISYIIIFTIYWDLKIVPSELISNLL